MELLPRYQLDLSAMNLLYIRSKTGALVPLSAVAHITQTAGALSVNHSGQLPSVTLSFNLRPGVALGQATDEVQRMANQVLPSSINTGFSGTAQAFQSTQAGMLALLGIAIFVIYFVLEAERSEGRAPADAIVHAALIRFRPIMMTTMCALMGTLPIAI